MTKLRGRIASGAAQAGSVIALASLAAAAAGFVVPALMALLGTAGMGPQEISRAGRIWRAFRFTLAESFLSSLLATAVGLPAAFFAARRNFPGRRFLLSLSAVPLSVPPAIVALAFVLFYGRQGALNAFLMGIFGLSEPPVAFLYTVYGLVFAQGLYNFPVVMRTVSRAWERLPVELEEAAALLGAGKPRIFLTVILPGLASPILSGAALVFLYCFFSFMIPLLFGGVGVTTLEVELYQSARNTLDFRTASLIAAAETAGALAILALYSKAQRSFGAGIVSRTAERKRRALKGPWERAAAAAFLGAIALFFVGPLLAVPLRSLATSASGARYGGALDLGLDAWKNLLGRSRFLPALGATLGTGLLSSAIASLAAVAFGYFAYGGPPKSGRGALTRLIPLLPLAVSPVMLGFGWTLLFSRGHWIFLAVAQASLSWPFAWATLQGSLERIPPSIRESSLLLSAGSRDAYVRVLLPLSSRGILSGAALAFAISVGDATLPLVLSVPRYENLAMLLFRLSGSYRFPEACACAVILAALAGSAFFLQDGDDNGH